jgi:hypothetical protein
LRYEITGRVSHPWRRVFRAYRDDVEELVPYLPNIARIEMVRREELGEGRTRIRRKWIGDYKVPLVARAFIKPDAVHWFDDAVWDEKAMRNRYTLELPLLGDVVKVEGSNRFEPEGEAATTVTISGELSLRLPALGDSVARKVEGFVIDMIRPNLEKINAGLQRYLDEHPDAGDG